MQAVNIDEVILSIMTAMYSKLDQPQLNELKNMLSIHLGRFQIYQEETTLSTSMDDYVDKVNMFLATLMIEGRTESTIKAYQTEYRVFYQMVNKNYGDINANDIRLYLAKCKTIRKCSDTTINNKIHMLMSLFKWLTANKYISDNPMLLIRIAKTEKRVKDTLSEEQIEIIRRNCNTERDLAIFEMLISTGIRIGELVKLNRSDIDFNNCQCIVYGKGRKERTVYFNGKTKLHIMWYLNQRTDDNPALFVTLKATYNRLTASGIRAMMKRICQDKSIKDINLHPHKLRRTMATNMINKGASVEIIKEILGHATVQTSLGYYCNISSHIIREAYRKYAG